MATRGPIVCMIASLVSLIAVAIVIVTLFLTVFKPKDPVISVHPVGLEHFLFPVNLSSNMTLRMVITIENPNYGSFRHEASTGHVNFRDIVIARVPMGAELVPPRCKINVSTSADFMIGKLLRNSNFWLDVMNGTLNFSSKTTLPGEAIMFKFIKLKATAYSSCDISLSIRTKDVYSKCVSKLKF